MGTFDIVIVPTSALNANSAALAAFNRAAQQWEAYISDPITVTINADLQNLDPGVLGQTSTVSAPMPYNTVRNAMVADAVGEPDDAITASLPTSAQALFFLPSNHGYGLTGNLTGSKSNLKALGFAGLDAQYGVSDASITFSLNFNFDYDRSDGITPGQFDFESVAAHEIGHVLGFESAVDDVDFALNVNLSNVGFEPTPLDMFRFPDNFAGFDPSTSAEFTTFARSLLPNVANATDWIDGQYTGSGEVPMATGFYTGADHNQASHWKDSTAPVFGIMDPTLAPGEISQITLNDLRALDLIGYEITLTAIPEVSSFVLLTAVGLMCVGVVYLRHVRV